MSQFIANRSVKYRGRTYVRGEVLDANEQEVRNLIKDRAIVPEGEYVEKQEAPGENRIQTPEEKERARRGKGVEIRSNDPAEGEGKEENAGAESGNNEGDTEGENSDNEKNDPAEGEGDNL